MPAITIITPIRAKNQNSLQWFHEMLASLAGQTFRNFEIVVVDDHSKEDIVPIVSYWKEQGLPLRAFKAEDKGVSAARNQAVEAAVSPLILPVDADDKLTTDALEKILAKWDEVGKKGIVYTDTMMFGQDYQRLYNAHEYDFTKLLRQPLFTVGALHKKANHDQVGGWRIDMTSGLEIWEYWIALGEIGVCGVRLPEPLYWYRRHTQGRLAWLKSEGQQRYKDAELRMRELHKDTFNGRYPMGCCGDAAASTKPGQPMRSTSILHRQTPTSELTQMLYVGKRLGGFQIVGNVTRVHYVIPGKGALVEQADTGRPGVLSEDVAWFRKIRQGRDFKIQSRPASPPKPKPPAAPTVPKPPPAVAKDAVAFEEKTAEVEAPHIPSLDEYAKKLGISAIPEVEAPPMPDTTDEDPVSEEFDPGNHKVSELARILDEMPAYSYPELSEMLKLEIQGKNRKGAIKVIQGTIDDNFKPGED